MNFQDSEGNLIPFLKGMRMFRTSEHPHLLMVGMPKDSPRLGDMVFIAGLDNKLMFSHNLTHGDIMSIATMVSCCVGCEAKYFTYKTGLNNQFTVEGYEFI